MSCKQIILDIAKALLLLVAFLCSVAAVCYGLHTWYPPAAFVFGGIYGLFVVSRLAHQKPEGKS